MYTIDGLPPIDPTNGYKLQLGAGVRGLPGRRASMVEIPGLDGVLPDYGAPFMPSTISLRYRIRAKTHAQFMAIVEKMNGVFGQRRKLLTVEHDYGNGTKRVNYATVSEEIVPEIENFTYCFYSVTLSFPSPFWRSAASVDSQAVVATASSATTTLTGTVGTAPITDALIRVKGAFSTLTLSDPVTGDQIVVGTPLTATEYIIIDTSNWTAKKVTTNTWTGGTDVSSLVNSNRGQGPMFIMEPDTLLTGGRYRLTISSTNPASSPSVQVRGKLSYL